MATKSGFAQKLLDDLRLRKERMGVSQGSARTNTTTRDAYRNTGNMQRSGSRQTKSLESIGGPKSVSSRQSDRALNINESSQQIVPYNSGQHQRSESIVDLSMAFTYAVKNGGKLMNMDFSTNSNTNSMIDFLHQIGRKSLHVENARNGTTMTSLVKHRTNNGVGSPALTTIQIKEISKGVQNLYEIIRSSSNSMEVGKELLKGAKGLEESLRMLVNLQEASEMMVTPQRKSRITLLEVDEDDGEDRSKIVDRNKVDLPRFSFDKPNKKSSLVITGGSNKLPVHRKSASYGGESVGSVSTTKNTSASSEKGRISNVIAKLMGLEEVVPPKRDEFKNDDKSYTNTICKISTPMKDGVVSLNDRKYEQIQGLNTKQSDKDRLDQVPEKKEKQSIVGKEKVHSKRRSSEVGAKSQVNKKKTTRNEIKLIPRYSQTQLEAEKRTQKSKQDSPQVKYTNAPLKEPKTQPIEPNPALKEPKMQYIVHKPPPKEPRPQSIEQKPPLKEQKLQSVEQNPPLKESKTQSIVHKSPLREPKPQSVEQKPPLKEPKAQSIEQYTPLKEPKTQSIEHKALLKERRPQSIEQKPPMKEPKMQSIEQDPPLEEPKMQSIEQKPHLKEPKTQSIEQKPKPKDPIPKVESLSATKSESPRIFKDEALKRRNGTPNNLTTPLKHKSVLKETKRKDVSIHLKQEETDIKRSNLKKSESTIRLVDIIPVCVNEIKCDPRLTSQIVASGLNEKIIKNSNLLEYKPKRAFNSSIQVVLTEDEKQLKEILIKDQLFLSTTQALFRLNIPLGFLHGDDHNHHNNETKLKLDCGYEILKRKARSQELATHPYVKPFVGTTIRFLDELVKQLYKDFESLRLYGRNAGNEYDEANYLHHMLERDIYNTNPDINSFWDFGWHIKTFTFVEKDEFVNDVEHDVIHMLVDEIVYDLLSMSLPF